MNLKQLFKKRKAPPLQDDRVEEPIWRLSQEEAIEKCRTLTILVVEDNPFLLKTMAAYLAQHVFAIDTALNGKEGLALYLNAPERYGLIFLDVHMPIMSGTEAAKNIRTSDTPRAKTIPLIAISGDISIETLRSPLFNFFLKKPFTMEMILDVIYSALSLEYAQKT